MIQTYLQFRRSSGAKEKRESSVRFRLNFSSWRTAFNELSKFQLLKITHHTEGVHLATGLLQYLRAGGLVVAQYVEFIFELINQEQVRILGVIVQSEHSHCQFVLSGHRAWFAVDLIRVGDVVTS